MKNQKLVAPRLARQIQGSDTLQLTPERTPRPRHGTSSGHLHRTLKTPRTGPDPGSRHGSNRPHPSILRGSI